MAAAVMAAAATGAAAAFQLYLRTAAIMSDNAAAAVLADENTEALYLLRDLGWNENIVPLSLNTEYFMSWSSTTQSYLLSTATTTVDGGKYLAEAVFRAVNRDGSFNISPTGTVDPGTRDVVISIYPASGTGSPLAQSETLIHDEFNN